VHLVAAALDQAVGIARSITKAVRNA
jgi:hypothetical protein